MLNVKELYSIINNAISFNIEQIAICTKEGNMLTYAGNDIIQADAVSSLFSQFWDETKTEVILHYENGPIYMTPLSKSYWLFIVGSKASHLGMIIKKAQNVKTIIGDTLEQFVTSK